MVCDLSTYRALLSIPIFALSLTPSTRCDYMILFGYRVKITRLSITWTLDGKLHRTDGPAVTSVDGARYWCIDGKFHRTDGPAIIRADGSQEWFIDDKHHRTDGPAIIRVDGSREWYINGNHHRCDGPAIIYASGLQYWYVRGRCVSELEFNRLKI
jgi:hypothetical protein